MLFSSIARSESEWFQTPSTPPQVIDLFSTKLPVELQRQIFDLAVYARRSRNETDEQENGSENAVGCLCAIGGVCRSWRKTVLECPFLWSRIELSRPDIARLSLERAGPDIPLIISLDTTRFLSLHYRERGEKLLPLLTVMGLSNRPEAIRDHPIHHVLDNGIHRVKGISLLVDMMVLWGPTLDRIIEGRNFTSLLRLEFCLQGEVNTRFAELTRAGFHELEEQLGLGSLSDWYPSFYRGLRADLLKELEIETAFFQRFTHHFPHLARVRIGPTMFFSYKTFEDLCIWLLQLPQLTHLTLDRCNLPPFSPPSPPAESGPDHSNLVSSTRVTFNTSNTADKVYFASSLRHLRIMQKAKGLGAAVELLGLIRPGHECEVEVDYTLDADLSEEEANFMLRGDSDYFRILEMMIAHNADPTALLIQCELTEDTDYLGLTIRRDTKPSSSSSSLSATYDHDLKESPDLTRSRFFLRVNPASSPTRTILQQVLHVLLFSNTLIIPNLTRCSLIYPQRLSHLEWADFIVRHGSITFLTLPCYDCGALFRTLTVELGEERVDESGPVDAIERLEIVCPQLSGAEVYWVGPRDWKGLVGYGRSKHQVGRALHEVRLRGVEGILEEDVEELKQFVIGGNVIVERYITTPSSCMYVYQGRLS